MLCCSYNYFNTTSINNDATTSGASTHATRASGSAAVVASVYGVWCAWLVHYDELVSCALRLHASQLVGWSCDWLRA